MSLQARTDALDGLPEKPIVLANLQTRLRRLDRVTQERLINWGYAIGDTGMRKWVVSSGSTPSDFPFHTAGLG